MQSTDLEEIRVRTVGASISPMYTGEVGSGASDGVTSMNKSQSARTGE